MEWRALKMEEDRQGKESQEPREAKKDQEMDSPFTASKRASPACTWILALWDSVHISEFQA